MRNTKVHWGLIAVLAALATGATLASGEPGGQRPRIARNPGVGQPPAHPLDLVVREAVARQQILKGIADYSCTFVKHERIDGQMREHQYISVMVRHNPFSVYMKFEKPDDVAGQQALYVAGKYNGKLMARGVGLKAVLGVLALDPQGPMATNGNRHPITEFGLNFLNLRIMDRAKQEIKTPAELTQVRQMRGAKVEGRLCTVTEISHPRPQAPFKYSLVRIFVDDQIGLPIRYETYDWPAQPGDKPVLLEEYTFQNLQFNNGFQDADFDAKRL